MIVHNLMSLVSHKKSYLVCVKLTNFRIFTQPIPIFFQTTKLRQPTEGRDSCDFVLRDSIFRQIRKSPNEKPRT